MKKLPLFLTVILFASVAHGQKLAEWTRQKKTQLKYLADQIAALQAYVRVVEKGYSIAKKGLNVIENIKKADFSLHSDYFNSLKNVRPNVKAYTKIGSIVAMQINLIKECHRQRSSMNNSGQFNRDEVNYAGRVFDNLLKGCTEIVDQLITLTTDGQLQMKDDERIKNIDKLYDAMQDRQQFLRHFRNENSVLSLQRIKELDNINTIKRLYGE